MYGNIGYTRRNKYKNCVLNRKQKENLIKLENELHNLQNERTLLYESDITDEELRNEVIPIQYRINKLIEQISNIKAEPDGRYPTIEVLKQIKAEYREIIFPDKPIEETCLDELCLNGERCYQGITDGIWDSWNNKISRYMKRKITLFFA